MTITAMWGRLWLFSLRVLYIHSCACPYMQRMPSSTTMPKANTSTNRSVTTVPSDFSIGMSSLVRRVAQRITSPRRGKARLAM